MNNRDQDCSQAVSGGGPRILQELSASWLLYPTLPVRPGDYGPDVRLVQEWLNLHNLPTSIDGTFGPETVNRVQTFRQAHRLGPSAMIDSVVFDTLARPMVSALSHPDSAERSLPRAVICTARKQLDAGAREVGGANRGPWVRLYMSGRDGAEYPWCAGFVSFVTGFACEIAGSRLPFKMSVSCNQLATRARRSGRFIPGDRYRALTNLSPGSLFLIRRRDGDWIHCGVVTAFHENQFDTIEGNTNIDGSPEGTAVCGRTRTYRNCDFIDMA